MDELPKNDFTAYNEARQLVFDAFDDCLTSRNNPKEQKAEWVLDALQKAETILNRYGLDDLWCSRHRKPKLREVVRTYILENLKMSEASLREMAPHLWERFSFDSEAKKRKKTEKSLVTEKGMNYLSLDEGREGIENAETHLDTESMIILDIVAQIAYNEILCETLKKEDIAELISFSPEERNEVLGQIPAIIFTDGDVRKMTSLKKLTGWQIERLCWKVKKVAVKPSKKIFYEEGHWHSFDFLSSIGDIQIERDGVTIKRGDIPEAHQVKHRYTISFNTVLGAIFLSNISQKKYRLLPLPFYKLSLPNQTLYRTYIALKKKGQTVTLDYSRVCRLLGEPPAGTNLARQRRRWQGYLDKLKKIKLLSYGKAEGKGKKTCIKMR